MRTLNYQHLFYFWTVAREGGVLRASERLHLSASAISGQIKDLERALGTPLLQRRGRGVEPTERGREVLVYADEIFGLGRELVDVLQGAAAVRAPRLRVGIADVVPKLVARALLAPALELAEEIDLSCREDQPERLCAELAAHELDVVLSDAPIPAGLHLRAFSHLLGECGVVCLAERRLSERLRGRFPQSLDGAPLVLPARHTALRRALDAWLESLELRPRVRGEFDDNALLKTFAQDGLGACFVPEVIVESVREQHGLHVVGRLDEPRERFYAISPERRVRHPAVVAITRQARRTLFR